jgi:hypothetical protein
MKPYMILLGDSFTILNVEFGNEQLKNTHTQRIILRSLFLKVRNLKYNTFPYYYEDQIKEDDLCWTCSTYGREDNCLQIFLSEILKEIIHFQDLGVNGRILKLMFKK